MRHSQPRIPRDVVAALTAAGLLNAFRSMRAAVRATCLQHIMMTRTEEIRKRRIEDVVDKVKAYNERHKIVIPV